MPCGRRQRLLPLFLSRESCKRAGDASRESDESALVAGRGSCTRAGDASPRVAPLANHPLHGISDVASHKRTCRVPIDGNKQSRARQEAVLLCWEATTNAPGPFSHPTGPLSHSPADPNGVVLTAQGEALGKRSPRIRGEPVRLVHVASHNSATCAERGLGMNGPFRTDLEGVFSSQAFNLRCVWRPSWILLRLR